MQHGIQLVSYQSVFMYSEHAYIFYPVVYNTDQVHSSPHPQTAKCQL